MPRKVPYLTIGHLFTLSLRERLDPGYRPLGPLLRDKTVSTCLHVDHIQCIPRTGELPHIHIYTLLTELEPLRSDCTFHKVRQQKACVNNALTTNRFTASSSCWRGIFPCFLAETIAMIPRATRHGTSHYNGTSILSTKTRNRFIPSPSLLRRLPLLPTQPNHPLRPQRPRNFVHPVEATHLRTVAASRG